jgi:DNA primase large subunit
MQVVGSSNPRPSKRSRGGSAFEFVGATPALRASPGGGSQDPSQSISGHAPLLRGPGYAHAVALSDPSVLDHPAYHPTQVLSFYEIPPTEEVTVEDFERAALARLRVLQMLDAAKAKGLKGQEFRSRVDQELRRAGLAGLQNATDLRSDVISHFALRFAFCRAADRRWFVQQETALFRHRLRPESGVVDNIAEFLRNTGKDKFYRPCTAAELAEVRPDLDAIEKAAAEETARALGFQPREPKSGAYYRVPFEEALEMVKRRRVLLRGGDAFVPEKEFGQILVSLLRAHLNRALATAYRAIQTKLVNTTNFETISPILHNLSVSYTDAESTYSADNVCFWPKSFLFWVSFLPFPYR